MPEPTQNKPARTYEVRREIDVRREGAGWVTEENAAEGTIEIPPEATRTALPAPDVGARLEWSDDDFVTSIDCPRCTSPHPCHQRLSFYTHTATILVVHEAPKEPSCN